MATKGFSEASSFGSKLKHEVFLSFRGEDTRKNFTDHLKSALTNSGVNTFIDDQQLPRGKDISSQLIEGIRESKISIVVFSKGYASSRWCLNELLKIIEYKNTIGRTVIPIFFDVAPSDVRKQSGSYAKAFAEHEESFEADAEMIKRWRAALSEAANLSGWDLQNIADGHESKFIKKIVDDVLKKVNRVYLHVATHPVALESRVKKVMAVLNIGTVEEVRIVGIYGMGGIGKTTIAKAVYNSICDGFDGSCFLSDIKEISKQPNGLASIQQQLLSDILNLKSIRIHNVDRGINLIQEMLCYRRALLVLDDVDDSTQLKSLVGNRKWFGVGSRIIVTTRDERLLTELEVNGRYKVEELNREDSLQLFCWHAFRRPNPKNGYFELSMSVVDHVQGLPLALEVLGSHLFKRDLLEWESVVEKLLHIPHDQIQKKLRISFDSLDSQSKAIFLDVACFFIGMDKGYVMKILDGCGFFPVIGVSVLLERSLITIGQSDNKLKMHDLLRDMGREIVREASPNHIGKRSRLWFHQDVVNTFRSYMGTEAVEGISLDVSAREDVFVSTEAFAKMVNLRLLKINSVHLCTGCYEKFSKELRWLCWHRCPLKVLPPNLDLGNLAVLDMRFSNVKKVWKETKILHRLKILDLSYSVYLVKTPKFSGRSNLERLEFEGCTSLSKVHRSIGLLERLVFLNLAKCNNLKELPDSICSLRSLETLNLSDCSKLNRLPEHLGRLEALRKLFADRSAIKQLPVSLGLLKNLEHLLLAGCKEELTAKSSFSSFSRLVSRRNGAASSTLLPAMFYHLSSIQWLNLSHQNLSDSDISIDFGSFPFLYLLNLTGNKFYNLPVGINNHSRLICLCLYDCTNLQSIRELPPYLRFHARERHDFDCSISVIKNWDLHHLSKETTSSYLRESKSEGSFSSDHKCFEVCFPGSDMPNWLDYKEMGTSVLFHMPSTSIGEIGAMILCLVYCVNEEHNRSTCTDSLTICYRNKSKGYETLDRHVDQRIFDKDVGLDHIWLACLSCLIFEEMKADQGDEIEISVEVEGRILVKKCGIHLAVDRYFSNREIGA
ncbi:hypothetical protein DITRI_Ditri17bG0031800 [Diplodiscus trichospermus]